MEFIIRDGTPDDVSAIAGFQVAMAMETENKMLDLQTVIRAVNRVFTDGDKGFYLVAESAGQTVGSLLVTKEWSDWRDSDMWYIQSVFVEANARGQGIFKALYKQVIERATQESIMFVRLYVEVENEKAQKVYESLGMKRMPYYMYDVRVT